MLCRCCLTAGLLFFVLGTVAQAGNWPAFRGPAGNGISPEKNLPITWSPQQNVLWRVELPGPGNSSPIVSNGRVFVTCATDKGQQRMLYCFDRQEGRELWKRTVEYDVVEKTHQTNPYCGSTPAVSGERIVVWHGSAGLFCYDLNGKQLWDRQLGKVGHIWGYGSSPVIYGNAVFLNFGPGVESFMTALNLRTGETLWKMPEPGGANDRSGRIVGSWSTPIIAKVDGHDQLICSMPTRVVAYDPADGNIIWSCDGLTSQRGDLVYTSPLISGELCVALGGYQGPALCFRLGGSGNVTENNRLWRNVQKQPQRIGSGVIIGRHIFTVNAGPGTAECIELETGKQLWQARLPGNNSWGSLIFADGRLYVTGQDGTTSVFLPNPERFDSVATNQLGEPSNSTPAFSDSQIFIRTHSAVYCIGERAAR